MGVDVAVILAGGKSTRLGRDKALETIGGLSMLERMVRAAGAVCAKVVVVGRKSPPEDWPRELAAEFVADGIAGGGERSGGPLVGVIRGLEILQRPALVLACDMPLISSGTLRALVDAHEQSALATMACVDGEVEPTVAVYLPHLLPELRRMLAENRRSLQQVAKMPGVRFWNVPAEHVVEFLNVNDEGTLAEARRRTGGA